MSLSNFNIDRVFTVLGFATLEYEFQRKVFALIKGIKEAKGAKFSLVIFLRTKEEATKDLENLYSGMMNRINLTEQSESKLTELEKEEFRDIHSMDC